MMVPEQSGRGAVLAALGVQPHAQGLSEEGLVLLPRAAKSQESQAARNRAQASEASVMY